MLPFSGNYKCGPGNLRPRLPGLHGLKPNVTFEICVKDCCTPSNPCGEGQGCCNSDEDCGGKNLICSVLCGLGPDSVPGKKCCQIKGN